MMHRLLYLSGDDYLKKKDILLIVILLIISAAGLLFINMFGKNEGAAVVITVDGKEYGTYPLNSEKTIEIDTEKGHNTVVISGGTVDVTEADCPDKICADHARIRYDHETIICLPHKMVVEIKGGEEADVD